MTIGVAILTLNGAKDLETLLPIITSEAGIDRICVIDSASTDNTQQFVENYPTVEYVPIARAEFNHGATREFARKYLASDIVVFLTQDVIPVSGFLQKLVQPIVDSQAVVTYARQLAHLNASFFEAFPRTYNYPETGGRRTIADAKKYGIFTFFCSDSCSAYLNKALDEIGGMEPILTNEDYFAVAKLLQAGHAIAYVAESQVYHSHSYTLSQEFRRYFDTGYVRGENAWVNKLVGQAEGHGSGFVKAMLLRLAKEHPHLVPFAIVQTAVKWFGYRLGYLGPKLPLSWCRAFSSQRYYWGGKYCKHLS